MQLIWSLKLLPEDMLNKIIQERPQRYNGAQSMMRQKPDSVLYLLPDAKLY